MCSMASRSTHRRKQRYRWAHEGSDDPELMEFTKGNAHGTNALVFGRVTYEVMVVWWPTPAAAKAMPEIAKSTNEAGGTIWLIPQLTS
jgi:dihydrofolate reductase